MTGLTGSCAFGINSTDALAAAVFRWVFVRYAIPWTSLESWDRGRKF